ncbi:MAG: DUF1329 domain-containing protein [Candidatus Binatia bacterium]
MKVRIAIALSAALAVGSVTHAVELKPGDKFDASNVDQIKDLISPGLEWCVKHGWPITIGEYKPIAWPAAYKEATEKYSAQVKLGKDGLTLENYVAGQPFPVLDPNDPELAKKIMWNYEYKTTLIDDADVRNFDADTGTIYGGTTPMSVERHFLLDHFRGIRYVGRLYNDPKPTWQTNEGIQAKSSLHPILEPFDLKGVGGLSYRYIDPSKQDDTWLYLPSLRRVRRLSTAQRSDALFGQDTDVDSYYGYAGHIAWMEWKYLGEKEMLGVYHANNFPVKWATGGADYAFDDVFEKRKVYVIEGTSKLAQYAYGKRILFIDKETFTVPYSDIYDRAGQLWKIWINQFTFRKQPFPGAKLAIYPDERAFLPSIVMVDMQLSHATKAALPSHRYPGEEGWYFDLAQKSGTTEDFFTVAHLISSGR